MNFDDMFSHYDSVMDRQTDRLTLDDMIWWVSVCLLVMQGAGCGMPSQRQRQYQQQRVVKAADNVFDYRTQKIAAVYENAMITRDKQETRKRTMRSVCKYRTLLTLQRVEKCINRNIVTENLYF